MVDIIEMGSSSKNNGGTNWIDKLLPIGVLAVAGYLFYTLLMGKPSGSGSTEDSGLSGSGSYGSGGYGGSQQQLNSGQGQDQGQVQQQQLSDQQRNTGQGTVNLQAAQQTQPAPGASKLATLINSPVNPVIVTAGPSTPTTYYPGGTGVITASRDLTPAEQQKVVQNLATSIASQGITNAWWQQPTITQTTQPGGINSGGSYQSNIKVGTKHCTCTEALRKSGVCGPNDDWYVCPI